MAKELLNYIKWTLQVEQVNHDTLMDYKKHMIGKHGDDLDFNRVCFRIAQHALDKALTAQSNDGTPAQNITIKE